MDYQTAIILKEKYCYKCEHFYEGTVCGFVVSSEEDGMEEVITRRKNVCDLDKALTKK